MRRIFLPRVAGVVCAVLLATSGLCGASAGEALPKWLVEAVAQPTPTVRAGAPALVLLDEWIEEVQPNGHVNVVRRHAVRILNRAGPEEARGSVYFREKYDRVKSSRAWLLRGGKEIKPPKTLKWADVSDADAGTIFDEGRRLTVDYSGLACIGDVFAFETEVDRQNLFAQLQNFWHSWLPILRDRMILRLPAGWSCTARLDGPRSADVRSTVAGNEYTWELLDQPYQPDEPAMAPGTRLAARLRLDLVPATAVNGMVGFRSWAEVVDWDIQNARGQCDSSPALSAAASDLTRDCSDSLAKIRALARYVQQLRYVEVSVDLALGAGYRPRKASEVFARGWGDCKDKANLLVALLREVGIEAFMVSANIGEGRQIDPDWPSEYQFNHAITAIRVAPSVDLAPVVEVAGIGRLLFFDPTSPTTLVGDLPWPLQGTWAQVLCRGNNQLTLLPVLPTERFHVYETKTDLTLDGAGVEGKMVAGGAGEAGALLRQLALRKTEKEQRKGVEDSLNAVLRGAQVRTLSCTDDLVTGDRRLVAEFAAPQFGQVMPGNLRIVRLGGGGRAFVPVLAAPERYTPIELRPVLDRNEVVLHLPAGVEVEELPQPTEIDSVYGYYSCQFERVADGIAARTTLLLSYRVVPAAEYSALRKFLGDVAKADRAAVVLRQEAAIPAQ